MNAQAASILAIALLLPVTTSGADEAAEPATGARFEPWEEWRGSGVWRSNYYESSTGLDDEYGFLGATAQIKLLPEFTDDLDAKLEVRATNAAIGEGGETRVRMLEGFASIHFERADLHVGKQIIAWGRADGINPTDNVSPRDHTVMLPFEEDQRVGTTAIRLDLFLSQDYTLSIVGAPYFEPSKIALPGAFEISERRPPHTLSNAQGGMRLNKVGEGFDWSLSYYRGFSLLPAVRAVANGAAGTALELHYDRIGVVGLDFARNIGRFGIRGEFAWVDTSDDSGRDPTARNSHLFWVLGVDRTFHEYLNVNLQFFERRSRGFQDPGSITDPSLQAVARLNSIVDGLPERVSHGISFRVSHQWLNETLEAEIFAAVNLTGSNRWVRPLLTYALNDRWKATIGANLYGGGPDTQFGSLEANRGAFAELRYGF